MFSHFQLPIAKVGGSRMTICNVTNNNGELFPNGTEDPGNPEWLDALPEVDPNTPNPELGDLRSRVPHDWFDIVQDKFEFPEDQEYWFNAPPDGWIEPKPKRLKVLKRQPFNISCSADHPGEGRTKLSDLEEGQVFTGDVTELALIHGIQVDIGAEFDGLIPVLNKYMWDELKTAHNALGMYGEGALNIAQAVKVRIHKIRDPDIYRWPVQLVLEVPAYPCMSPENFDPDSWRCPKDLRGINKPEDLARYFTKEELDRATAKILLDDKYDALEDDHDEDSDTYYYREEQVHEGTGVVLNYKWKPLPVNKEGQQPIVEFVRKGIDIVSHEQLYGVPYNAPAHPWDNAEDYPKFDIMREAQLDLMDHDGDMAVWE